MNANDVIRALLFFGPIALLVIVGLWLALRSGPKRTVGGSGSSRVVSNLSQAVVILLVWLVAAMAVQQVIGASFHLR